MSKAAQFLSTRERAYYGCLVTLVEIETGEMRVEHAAGYAHESGRWASERTYDNYSVFAALKRLLQEVDQWEGEWRVRTISTPATIIADLRGRQTGNEGARPAPPEASILTHIGRIDMWEGKHADEGKRDERARRRAAAG